MTERPYKLPEGWRWVRLVEVVNASFSGGTPSTKVQAYWDGDIPWTTSAPIAEEDVLLKTHLRTITQEGLENSASKIAPSGSLILATRVGVGKAVVATFDVAISQDLTALVLCEDVNPVFLAYTFKSGTVQAQLRTRTRGTTIKGIPRKELLTALIPLPPRPEQRRIVARIEELMSRVREAKRLRRQAKEDAERLWQSALVETFPRPGTEPPPGWRWVRLGEVCETKMGGTPSTKDTEYWEPPEIVWVTPEDLGKCELNRVFSSRRLISRAGLEKSSAKLFPHKTVLLSTTATIGKVGVAEKPLSANQQISGIICGDNVNPEFLAYYLLRLGETGLKQLGGTATATHINQTNLRSLPIPLPPLDEQQHIVTHLEAVQEKIRALKFAQTETDEELKHLEQAALDKAFRGEL